MARSAADYSDLITCIGSRRDARRAGIHAAAIVVASRKMLTPTSVLGSRGERPKTNVARTRAGHERDRDSGRDARGREDHSAAQHVPHNPSTARAKRNSDSDLAGAPRHVP